MFSRVFFFVMLFIFNLSFSQINWLNWDEAMMAQKENPKKIFIQFYADYCKNCKEMDKTTFQNSEIYKHINEHYYAVKFNIEDPKNIIYKGYTFGFDPKLKIHTFATYMNVNMTPSMVFLNEKSNPITILQGRLTARELEPYLQFFATDKHLKIKSKADWSHYLRKFKSKIKE